jgi:hypothetical protein
MRITRVRFSVRAMMVAVAVVAIGLWAGMSVWPPSRVLAAARGSVPGIVVQSIRTEKLNQTRAWEVRGTNPDGTVWLLDISAWGEVLPGE